MTCIRVISIRHSCSKSDLVCLAFQFFGIPETTILNTAPAIALTVLTTDSVSHLPHCNGKQAVTQTKLILRQDCDCSTYPSPVVRCSRCGTQLTAVAVFSNIGWTVVKCAHEIQIIKCCSVYFQLSSWSL